MNVNRKNQKRAQRAAKALDNAKYYDPGIDWYSAMADLLTDLQHLADLHGFDFLCVLDTATANYSSESDENFS